MNKISFAFVLAFFIALSFTGCKSTKKVGTVEAGGAKAHNEFFALMQEQAFKYETLTARLNVDLNLPGNNMSSRVDLKMVKDSAFQLSVQPFLGIEVFRAEISVDSVKVIDRMNKRYVADNYANLKGQTPIEFNFYNLQALFTNHLFLPGQQGISPKQYSRFKLKQDGPTAEIQVKDVMGLLYTFMADGEDSLNLYCRTFRPLRPAMGLCRFSLGRRTAISDENGCAGDEGGRFARRNHAVFLPYADGCPSENGFFHSCQI